MGKIYTKSGDNGTTAIHSGIRVQKDDIRIEANGTLDELNSAIGIVRALIINNKLDTEQNSGPYTRMNNTLKQIQTELMSVMSIVATPSNRLSMNPNKLSSTIISECESEIDQMNEKYKSDGYFLLPGGSIISSHLQLARTIARRAERRLWSLHKQDNLPLQVMTFINRLSDLIFVMARYEMDLSGIEHEKWKEFKYKSKK